MEVGVPWINVGRSGSSLTMWYNLVARVTQNPDDGL